jgi:D-methionine transport system substrate-binding protein
MSTFISRRSLLAAAAALALSASGALAQKNQVIRIGVTPGPHAEIVEQIKPIIAKKGFELKIFEFSDFVIPNQALDTGDLEANAFQHQPYLDNQVKDRGFKIVSAATTVNFPMGIYSTKYKSWAEIPDGATVSIQNDPTNGGRALLLLQDKGVIKLKDGTGFKPTVLDITENPKKLKIIEIEAGQTVRSLDDVAAAAINTSYAVDAKIDPNSAILREAPKGPYTNLIAVRVADKDKPFVQALVDSYRSPEIKAFVAERFKGSILPTW